MESLIKAIILGIIQGLTEFLPISSSGHLVIFSSVLHFKESSVAFDVFLHFGTLLSIFVMFWKEIKVMAVAPFYVLKGTANEEQRYYWRWDLYVILATIPAGIVGVLFEDQISAIFEKMVYALIFLFVTGLFMSAIPLLKKRNGEITAGRSFLMGLAQAFAILPGISRSGSTIFTGILTGGEQEKVARFSFIMSIPAVAGAVVLKLKDFISAPPSSSEMLNMALGALAAFIFGCLAIMWLLDFVKKGKLQWFGYYCLAVSVIGLVWYFGF